MTSDSGTAVFVLKANAMTDLMLMSVFHASFMHTRRSAAPLNPGKFRVSKFYGNGLKLRSN